MAKFLYDRYKKPMYNTEFGFSQNYEGKTLEQKLDDKERLLYIRDHYEALRQAAKEGVDIRGAFQWCRCFAVSTLTQPFSTRGSGALAKCGACKCFQRHRAMFELTG